MSEHAAPWHPCYLAARESAALFVRPESALVEVDGPERLEYLNSLATNKLDDLEPGRARRAFFLSPTKGRVLADFLACETGGSTWLECAGGSAPAVLEYLRKYYFGQEVDFHERAGEWWVLALVGPGAGDLLTGVATDVPPGEVGDHEETAIGGAECRAVRWDDAGLPGWRLWVPDPAIDVVRTALEEAGAARGHEEAWDALQIEAGVAAFGRELGEETIPLEAPTGNALHFEKGCYPGQEVIARLHVRGRPARQLRGLEVEGEEPLAAGTVLDAADKAGVATVTAGARTPDLGSIALAFVHRDYVEAGTRLTAGDHAATVVDLPMR